MTDHINLAGQTAKKLENEIAATKLELLKLIRDRSKETYRGAAESVIAAAYAYSAISGGSAPTPPEVNTRQ